MPSGQQKCGVIKGLLTSSLRALGLRALACVKWASPAERLEQHLTDCMLRQSSLRVTRSATRLTGVVAAAAPRRCRTGAAAPAAASTGRASAVKPSPSPRFARLIAATSTGCKIHQISACVICTPCAVRNVQGRSAKAEAALHPLHALAHASEHGMGRRSAYVCKEDRTCAEGASRTWES